MPDNYVNTIYNLQERPLTGYPDELVKYVMERFHIRGGG